jgi:hypothetical protein
VGPGDGIAIGELYVDWCDSRFNLGTGAIDHDEMAIAPAVGDGMV